MNRVTSVLTRHWKSLLALNLFIIGFSIFKIETSAKIWSSEAQLIMPNTGSNLNADLGTLGSLNSGNAGFSSNINPLIAQQSILTSNIVMERLLAIDPEQSSFSQVGSYKGLFETEIAEQSTTMSLKVLSSSPELAVERANNWINVYQERLNELRKQESIARIDFSQEELAQAKRTLVQTQQELADFAEYSGLVNSEAQTQGTISLIDQLTAAKYQAETKAIANEKKVTALSSRLNMTPSQAMSAVSLSENQDYQTVKNKLQEAELKLSRLRNTHTEENPIIRDLKEERDKLKKRHQEYISQTAGTKEVDLTVANNSGRTSLIQQLVTAETEAEAQRKEAENLDRKITQLKADLQGIPARQNSLQKLKKQKDVAEGVYQGLIAKIQQTKIDAFNSYPQVQVLEPPTTNSKLVSPDKMLIRLNALLASIVGSTALIMLLEKRNPLLQSYDLDSYSFPIINSIRQLKPFGRSNLQTDDNILNILYSPHPHIEIDFQRLASAISLQPIENRRLLVTSAMAGEGKTTVTVGLAKALVDLGFRVLMVDADFHKAELTRTLSSVTFIRESIDLLGQTGNPIEILSNLYLQTTQSRQTNTAALVKQGGFERSITLAESRDNYDYIIVDSAPVGLTSEAALMACTISNVLFVVRPNLSERNSVYSSLEQLNQHRANTFGLVINGVENHSRYYNYDYVPRSLEPSATE